MLADTLQQLAGRRAGTGKKGEGFELLPPATEDQIHALEARLPCPVPADVREALRITTGLANGPVEFSLLDLEGFGLEEVLPHAYSIAGDGCGNFWVLDLLPGMTKWEPVFYVCHDPPVLAYQSATLEDFLRESLAAAEGGLPRSIDVVHDEVVHRIWRDNPDLVPSADLRDSADAVLKDFAASLPPNALVADLRRPSLGQGFSWGRVDAIRRAGHERVWAMLPVERKPGFFSRLFR